MRIFIVSDSHGRIGKALEAFSDLSDIDLIIHLGDFSRDAADMAKRLNFPVLSVKGNTDGDRSDKSYKILDTEFGKFFIAHGHMEGVKNGLQTLIYKAESLGCRGAFFGHTHRPLFMELSGFYLLNPGSIGFPGQDGKVSYAVASIGPDFFEASILFK